MRTRHVTAWRACAGYNLLADKTLIAMYRFGTLHHSFAAAWLGMLVITAPVMAVAGANLNVVPAPQFTHPFTLVELTDMALSYNPQTKLAWAEIRSSQAGVELAKAGYWPQISASYSITRSRTVNFSGASNSAQTRFEPSLSLSYLLWDFGSRSGTLDAAKYALLGAELSNSQTLQDVILAVQQDYYQVLGLQALEAADELSVKDAQASLDVARENRKSGLATVGDLYQAEAALAGTQLALQQTQGSLAVAQGTMAVEVGFPANTQLMLAPWNQNITPQMPNQTVESLLAQAREARPELLASKASEQEAIANLEATKGRGLPTLTLAADAGQTRTVGGGASQTADNYSAGLTLSIPLFAGFGDEAANNQAQAAVDVSQATTAQLQQQVELEVWQAYQNLHTAMVTLTTTAVQLKSAQQALDVELARYHIGLDPILNLLTAQATLASARAQQVQARLNWFTALAALGEAVGGLNAPKAEAELP
ncbi:MAG: TolC family protein [Gammaproteobacteria bacterium]